MGTNATGVTVAELRVEYGESMLADARPRLSWKVTTGERDWQQVQAELRCDDRTTIVETDRSVFVDWPFAWLYATAHGSYQVEINGAEVDDAVLKPGWTPYEQRLLYEATDVTDRVVAGANAVGVWLAGGWYTERYGFGGNAKRAYQGAPCAAQLDPAAGVARLAHQVEPQRGHRLGCGERLPEGVPGLGLTRAAVGLPSTSKTSATGRTRRGAASPGGSGAAGRRASRSGIWRQSATRRTRATSTRAGVTRPVRAGRAPAGVWR